MGQRIGRISEVGKLPQSLGRNANATNHIHEFNRCGKEQMNKAIRDQIWKQNMRVDHVGGVLVVHQGRDVIFRARSLKEIGAFIRREEAHVRSIQRDHAARMAR